MFICPRSRLGTFHEVPGSSTIDEEVEHPDSFWSHNIHDDEDTTTNTVVVVTSSSWSTTNPRRLGVTVVMCTATAPHLICGSP